ncbi:hypothetical protein [Flagellimonas hadalis]|uniref:NERD domain-containing protein n=1 Tax=Flagellimonas hadalis TaxID=2597517 RepID=A0A5N5IN87_9FLAO|nr:hypothetical protein [Allomuricauda hadalis]KAB5487635.1 hypothetical protein FOT42_011810 [Allomuricauda hadalis]
MTEQQKIRKFESDILDIAHINYEFYQYSEDVVIPYLLQVYGDTERHRDNLIANGQDAHNVSIYLSNMIHGIGHCIRWMLKQNQPLHRDISDESPRQLQEMAADFLDWGTGYHMIAQEFVTWSRGVKTAIFSEENKTITFLNPEGYNYSSVYDKQLLYAKQMQVVYYSYPHEEMESEYEEWLKDIDFSSPPIANHIDWDRGRDSKSYPLLYRKMCEILFPELEEITEFDGYNLRQLRQFYALFFLNFHFIRWTEAVLDSKSGKNLSFGSNPLYLSTNQFENLASTITGLPKKVVAAIINDLTFNPNTFHTSVSIQPLILSSSGTYYILPNLFSQLEPSRMILGALNKGSKKKIYDKLINLIEKCNLKELYNSVKDVGSWTPYLEKTIKFGGKQIHPDLILINSDDRCIYIIDYKHFIGPISASEVDYKMNELKKGSNQVKNYIELFRKLCKIGTTNIEGFATYGLLITHKPLPVPISDNIDIPILDMLTFKQKIASIKEGKGSINELMGIIEDDKNHENVFTPFENEIKVGEWKIIRSQHKITQSK